MARIPQRSVNLASTLTQTAIDTLLVARQLTDAGTPTPTVSQLAMLEEAFDYARLQVKEYRRKVSPIELKGQRV